jgi:pimeloyl-ACP methyl ester carboxylesterase
VEHSVTVRTIDLGDGDTTTLEQWGESGPALVCVHGIGSSRKSWARTAEAFAGAYRVFAYDQRGHGDSAAVLGPMTHEQSMLDLTTVANAIGGGVHALIGHSWGGAIAILGGRRIACARVLAIDPLIRQAAGGWAADYVDDLVPLFAPAPDARGPVIRALFADSPPVEIDAKVHALQRMTIEPIVALGAENGVDAGAWDLREAVRAYPKPLMLLLADPSDSVVSADDLAFVRANGGPNVGLEIFTGEGHTLHRSAFERYARSTAAFLAA